MIRTERNVPSIAPLKNVALCMSALEKAIGRKEHLPGIVDFHGPSGFGKSFAACYAMIQYKAIYVVVKSTWTRKALLIAIAKELGCEPGKTLYDLTEQVSERLALSKRPVIIDEMDHVADKGYVEVIRDIYEGSGAPILLIGEEGLPGKLRKWERFHGRLLDWVPARPRTPRTPAYSRTSTARTSNSETTSLNPSPKQPRAR